MIGDGSERDKKILIRETAAREGFPIWRLDEVVEWDETKFAIVEIQLHRKRLVLRWLSGPERRPALRSSATIKGVTWELVEIPGDYVIEYREKAKGILAMMQRVTGQR